jgi:uncharacterized membrane protein YphA (DoxX/SURF4 family)
MIWLNRYTDTVYCIIRVVVGLMFACHGGQKILGAILFHVFAGGILPPGSLER